MPPPSFCPAPLRSLLHSLPLLLCSSHSFGNAALSERLWPALSHKGEAWIQFGVHFSDLPLASYIELGEWVVGQGKEYVLGLDLGRLGDQC